MGNVSEGAGKGVGYGYFPTVTFLHQWLGLAAVWISKHLSICPSNCVRVHRPLIPNPFFPLKVLAIIFSTLSRRAISNVALKQTSPFPPPLMKSETRTQDGLDVSLLPHLGYGIKHDWYHDIGLALYSLGYVCMYVCMYMPEGKRVKSVKIWHHMFSQPMPCHHLIENKRRS